MKKSELRILIRESIKRVLNKKNLLTEKFASKTAGKLYSKLKKDSNDKLFFAGMAKTHDIDWANAPESAFGKGPDPKLINFFFVNKQQRNPFAGYNDWDVTIYPGLIGVTRGKEKLHVVGGRWNMEKLGVKGEKSTRGGYSGRGDRDAMGQALKNLHNYKRFAEVADEVITIDTNQIPSSTELKAQRKAAKQGATALMAAKQMASDNISRYEKALSDRLADSSPGDQIIKIVDAVTKMYKETIDNQVAMLKKKKVSAGWNDSATYIQRAYRDIMQDFEYYLRDENSAVKGAKADKKNKLKAGDKEAWSEEKYYKKSMIKYARKIQKEYKSLKNALTKVDKSKEWRDV
ncbi:hypothetical protein CMI47_10450 [Candidatus Pacearchaeota archaeon]|nr:hypothetical protein [Candidatus Pacearchaeota archaeon]